MPRCAASIGLHCIYYAFFFRALGMFEIHVHILVLLPFLSFTCMMIHTFHGGFHHRKQINREYSKCKRKYSKRKQINVHKKK